MERLKRIDSLRLCLTAKNININEFQKKNNRNSSFQFSINIWFVISNREHDNNKRLQRIYISVGSMYVENITLILNVWNGNGFLRLKFSHRKHYYFADDWLSLNFIDFFLDSWYRLYQKRTSQDRIGSPFLETILVFVFISFWYIFSHFLQDKIKMSHRRQFSLHTAVRCYGLIWIMGLTHNIPIFFIVNYYCVRYF